MLKALSKYLKDRILCHAFFKKHSLSVISFSIFQSLFPSPFSPKSLFPSQNTSLLLFFFQHCAANTLFVPPFSSSRQTSLWTLGQFIGPFGPQLLSRLCLCQNPAAFHWLLAAEGAKQEGEWEMKCERGKVKKNIEVNDVWRMSSTMCFFFMFLARRFLCHHI